jgi:hypothetical protein
MPNSLLLTLLTTDGTNETAITAKDINPKLPQDMADDVQININTVVNSIRPHGKRNLIKDVAQKELYEVLYSIIRKGYDDTPMTPADQTLNRAIAMALEIAIREASQREVEGKPYDDDSPIIDLRKKLRGEIIEALKPK